MTITDLIPWKKGGKQIAVKRDYEDPFVAFRREMNRLFDEFFSAPFDLAPFGGFGERLSLFSPDVDVTESDKDIKVSAELPGMDEDDIEVTLSHNILTISGEKKAEKEDKGKNYYRMERTYGSFRRDIPLPCEVEADKVEARFKKGVLTITLPKTPEAQRAAKRITVKTA